MAVQFNLLPDIKLEYAKQQSTKRLVYTLSFVASAVVITLVVATFFIVNVLQKQLLSNANKDIASYSQKLKQIPDIEKVLTVQNQLGALPGLHQQKHRVSRLFSYLPQITPSSVHIGKLSVDIAGSTISITGTANNVESVNKFVDTLKNSGYVIDGATTKAECSGQQGKWLNDTQQCAKLAFSNVVLTKIDRDEKNATYTIDTSFDAALFTGDKAVVLVVPKETTSQSVVNAPSVNSLFNGDTGSKKSNQQGTP